MLAGWLRPVLYRWNDVCPRQWRLGCISEGCAGCCKRSQRAGVIAPNVEGTLGCLWSPKYSSSLSVPGHFVSKDRTKGRHVLDCSAQQLRARIQIVSEYDIRLPEAGSFLTTDLIRDPASDLAKAE